MQLPAKIRKYPFISATLTVVLVIMLGFGAAHIVGSVASVFGADRVACWIEYYIGINTDGTCVRGGTEIQPDSPRVDGLNEGD